MQSDTKPRGRNMDGANFGPLAAWLGAADGVRSASLKVRRASGKRGERRDMTEPTQPSYLVFVSHSAQDIWVAKQLAREVSSHGAEAFLDESCIETGARFEMRILDSLRDCHELIVLLTPWALERNYIWAELGAAWLRQIPIVGILHGITIGEITSRLNTPIFIKERDMIDINTVDRYFSQLGRRVSAHRSGHGIGGPQ